MQPRKPGLVVLLAVAFLSLTVSGAQSQSSVTKQIPPAPAAAGAPNKQAARVAGSYGNWTLLCGKEGKDQKAVERCSLVLPLIEKETQKLIFRVIFTYGPKGRLLLRVDGPTGVALQRGMEFSPDAQKIYRLPFQTCLPMGCKALLIVQDELRKELVKAKQATITVFALNGRAIKTVATLNGFSKGLKAMKKQRKKKK